MAATATVPDVLSRYQHLGAHLAQDWRKKGSHAEVFPALAAQLFREYFAECPYTLDPLLALAYANPIIPEQLLHRHISDSPRINLYKDELIQLDLYFWIRPTIIHSHHFWGAFQVVHGQSLHALFDFEDETSPVEVVSLGKLKVKKVELLAPGDVRGVVPGMRFIHQVYHLSKPTVSLVARLVEGGRERLEQCFFPGLAMAMPLDVAEEDYRMAGHLGQMLDMEHPGALACLQGYCADRSARERLPLVMDYLLRCKPTSFDEAALFAMVENKDLWCALLGAAQMQRRTSVRWETLPDMPSNALCAALQLGLGWREISELLVSLGDTAGNAFKNALTAGAIGLKLNETGLLLVEAVLNGQGVDGSVEVIAACYGLGEHERIELQGFAKSLGQHDLLRGLFR